MKRLASTFGLRCTKSGSDGLTFFLAACVVVSFGFVTEIVLITHQGVDCWVALLIASRLAFFPLLQQWGGWGWARGWEGDTAGTAEPGWPQGYFMPCNIVLSSKKKKKMRNKGFEGGSHCWETVHQSTYGRWWVIAFALLFSSFLCLLNCFYLNTKVFSLLLFLIIPHSSGA